MSYFYNILLDQNNSIDLQDKKKHVKSKKREMDDKPEPIYNSVSRRRRPSKTRCNRTSLENLPNHGQDEEKISSPKSKSRRHLRKEIERLAEKNNVLTNKLEDSHHDAEIIEHIKQKNVAISKLCNKCDKLTKEKENMKTEILKLNSILEDHETNTLKQFEKEKAEFYLFQQKLKSENLQLNEDVALLKNLVYRLNVELERYQDKLRQYGQSNSSHSNSNLMNQIEPIECDTTIIQSWGAVDKHALGPLLNAYQQNLVEKEELIIKYGQDMEEFSGRCKEVVIENENFQKEIANLKSQIEIHQREIETIAEDAAIIKQQNDLLTQQTILHKQKIQDIHTVYEQKVESMSQDNNKLYKDYMTCKTELSNVLGKYEILNEGYEKFKTTTEKTMPVSVHNAAVEECRRLFEELKSQYEMEKKKLSLQITQFQESQPDIEKQLITVTAEKNQSKITCKTLEKNWKRTQNKLEYLQNNMYSLQVSRDSFKRQLNKTISYCKELVSEYEKVVSEKNKLSTLLQDRDKENANIHYLGDNISQRMGNLKSQLKNVQKGATNQLTIVEKHMKMQETEINQLKSEYCREIERLKQLVKHKEDIIGKLQKEKYETQNNLELIWKAAASDDRKVKDKLKTTKVISLSNNMV